MSTGRKHGGIKKNRRLNTSKTEPDRCGHRQVVPIIEEVESVNDITAGALQCFAHSYQCAKDEAEGHIPTADVNIM